MTLPDSYYDISLTDQRDQRAPRVSWEEFTRQFKWRAGEHIGIIGPTGSGKTNLALHLLPMRRYVVALATKPQDKTMVALHKSGYLVLRKWEALDPTVYPRRILWPEIGNMYLAGKQRKEIQRALGAIYQETGWCVYADELWYLTNALKLEFEVRMYLLQARSLGISFVAATQRPSRVPLEVYDQSSHLFFFRDNDEANLKRISGISWLSANLVRSLVARLDGHEFLYIENRTGRMIRATAPLKEV